MKLKNAKENTMKLKNFTPHTINLISAEGVETTIESSGIVRVSTIPGEQIALAGSPVPIMGADQFGEVEGLPEPEEGTYLIVSALVGGVIQRKDLLVPGTAPADNPIRKDGRIIGVRRLKRV
ncbi:MAG: hypothetical protein GY861_00435 [bacterium]|nr:hypothetical protein [bacterium]